jgi:hypothetical protein
VVKPAVKTPGFGQNAQPEPKGLFREAIYISVPGGQHNPRIIGLSRDFEKIGPWEKED